MEKNPNQGDKYKGKPLTSTAIAEALEMAKKKVVNNNGKRTSDK